MLNLKALLLIFFLMVFTSCQSDEDNRGEPSEKYALCNEMLLGCSEGNGDYCLLGYKWGGQNPFESAGFDVSGPQAAGGLISFSFQESKGVANTHSQINITSKSFEGLPKCAKTQIRKAFDTWASLADISFEEASVNSDSQIRIFAAEIRQSGVGYPNFPAGVCTDIGGDIIINSKSKYHSCESFYRFVLHEIGHTLGLGHVKSENIMNPDRISSAFTGPQSGDAQGIQQIYGPTK